MLGFKRESVWKKCVQQITSEEEEGIPVYEKV